jgi:hypothetical protein
MCMTQFSPQATMTTPYQCASQHQRDNCNCLEQTRDREQLLHMQWVVETDADAGTSMMRYSRIVLRIFLYR